MKLSSGKLQFWKWKSPLLVRENLVPRPSCILQSSMPEDIYGMEEYKMPARARYRMFRHQQGAFPFSELQLSKGELHFD
jgi:hypothetical protein